HQGPAGRRLERLADAHVNDPVRVRRGRLSSPAGCAAAHPAADRPLCARAVRPAAADRERVEPGSRGLAATARAPGSLRTAAALAPAEYGRRRPRLRAT